MRVFARSKRVKVKNRDTGKILYKTPKELSENRAKYQQLPTEYDRRPQGKPRKTPDPGQVYLPAPARIPRPKKPKKPKKRKKLPRPVPLPKPPEPPRPAPADKPPGLKWDRKSG